MLDFLIIVIFGALEATNGTKKRKYRDLIDVERKKWRNGSMFEKVMLVSAVIALIMFVLIILSAIFVSIYVLTK